MTLRAYVLPPDQLERLREAGGPLADRDTYPSLDALRSMTIGVVELDDRLVAYWVIWYALHAEPLHLAEAVRHHPGVARSLIQLVQLLIEQTGEPSAFATIEDENLPIVESYAGRLGFHRAPGSLFYLVLPTLESVEG